MKILVTNDDGINSQFILPLAEVAKELGDVTICAPHKEQSWKGKSMTRHGTVKFEKVDSLINIPSYTTTGTPADCVQIAHNFIYKDSMADIIFSGINYGINAGIGYIASSGTVGACLEGNILGIPGISVSQLLPTEIWQLYSKNGALPEDVVTKTMTHAKKVLRKTVQKILSLPNAATLPLTWNINLPYEYVSDEAQITTIGTTAYKVRFAPLTKDGETHFVDSHTQESEACAVSDSNILRKGIPTLTVIDIHGLGQMREDSAFRLASMWR